MGVVFAVVDPGDADICDEERWPAEASSNRDVEDASLAGDTGKVISEGVSGALAVHRALCLHFP